MSILRTALLLGMAVSTAAILLEIRAWMASQRQVSKRQKAYRVTAVILMETIFLLIFFSSDVLRPDSRLLAIYYMTGTVALTSALLVVALLDVRETLAGYGRQKMDAYRDLLGEEKQGR